MATRYFFVTVTKNKTGEVFSGVMEDDGLQSLCAVYCEDGEPIRYASVMDDIFKIMELDEDQYRIALKEVF